MHYFELRHGGFIPLCPWQIFVRGCFCWALPLLLFALLLCWMAKRISGWGICVSPFVWLFLCFLFGFDLPCYMTTGVNVDFISNCFFTCKDRALERDRPYQRKKKSFVARLLPVMYLDMKRTRTVSDGQHRCERCTPTVKKKAPTVVTC